MIGLTILFCLVFGGMGVASIASFWFSLRLALSAYRSRRDREESIFASIGLGVFGIMMLALLLIGLGI